MPRSLGWRAAAVVEEADEVVDVIPEEEAAEVTKETEP